MSPIRYKQNLGNSKGQIVKFLMYEGVWVWVKNIKNKFIFKVQKTDFEKYYDQIETKVKKKKKIEKRVKKNIKKNLKELKKRKEKK